MGLVGAEVGREDLVELLSDLEDAVAGPDVPDDDAAELGAAAAAGEEQGAAAAEAQHLGTALGVGQDAGEVEGVRVVEQHLVLARDGGDRRPGP